MRPNVGGRKFPNLNGIYNWTCNHLFSNYLPPTTPTHLLGKYLTSPVDFNKQLQAPKEPAGQDLAKLSSAEHIIPTPSAYPETVTGRDDFERIAELDWLNTEGRLGVLETIVEEDDDNPQLRKRWLPEIPDVGGYVPDMSGYKMPEIDMSAYRKHATHQNATIAAGVVGVLVFAWVVRLCVKTMRSGRTQKDGFAWDARGGGEGLPW